jgi:hypothetical protein
MKEHRQKMFEKRMLRRIFGPKREKVTSGWRKIHYGELHNLYFSAYFITVIRSRRMRWAGHTRQTGNAHTVVVRLKRRDYLEGLGVDGKQY